MTERYIADADLQTILQPPSDGGYFCPDFISIYYIFTTCDSISTWYNIDDTKAAGQIKERYGVRQDKTHCGRGLITDPITRVVMNVDADLE